jgi:hypothetical protein
MSNAFAASLSFGFGKEAMDYSVNSEDTVIEKYAGISIYQPTIDNCELFIRKFVMNELTGMDGVRSIDISLIPNKFDTIKPDYVKDAQGVVSIKVDNVMLELPFMMLDEEFLPFDIIQLDKQRVPYSRENLRKVIAGVINQKKVSTQIPDFEPFKKLDKPINPASSIGFLGDVLKIKEQHAFRTTSGGNMYVTASAKIDEALEKLANMKPVTEEDWKVLENMIRNKVVEGEVDALKKEASVINSTDDTKMAMIFNRVKEIPFVDANTLPHGTVVAFPEVCDKEISMNKGIIIDDYMDMAGYNPKKMKIIVSQDSRMKVLENFDRFLCIKIPPEGFRIHARELDILMGGDVFLAFDGNKALVPCVVSRITERLFKNGGEVGFVNSYDYIDAQEQRKSSALGKSGIKIYYIKPIYKDEQVMSVFSDDGVDHSKILEDTYHEIKLATLSGVKFGEVPYNEYIKKKADELGIKEMNAMSLAPHYDVVTKHDAPSPAKRTNGNIPSPYYSEGNVVFCTDENTKIIRIKGIIKHHMRNKEDLELMANASVKEFEVVATDDEGFEKEAGVEGMASNCDLGGDRFPDSPMKSFWLYGVDQSQKQAFEDARDDLEKFASEAGTALKAVANQASRFTVKGNKLQTLMEKKLDAHAHRLATKDWANLKAKGYLSPDQSRVIKPFNFMGQDLKQKGFDHIKGAWKQALSKGKSIGTGNKTITDSKFTDVKKVSWETAYDDAIEKTASNEYAELRSVDKQKGTYDLTITHIDRNKKLLKNVTRTYKAIPYGQVREILKAVGYDIPKISEILNKARMNNYAKYELPAEATPTKLVGGQISGPVRTSLEKVKNTIYDSNISDAVAAEVLGSLLAGAILGAGATSKPIYNAVQKFAAESAALSSEFEKIAMEKQSQSAREVAKTMALASMFNEKVASVISGKAQYFKLNDVVDDIIESQFALEKMASDLITLKVQQKLNGEVLINPGYIQGAIKNLDHMFRLAHCLDNV